MLDFMFAVTHASHWHSINMHQFPGHYPLYSRMLGSDFVSRVEDISPGVWFNAFVPMKGVVSFFRVVQNVLVTFHPLASLDHQVWRHDSGQPLLRPA